ncbi:MAG: M24 family metallopeptidase [Rhizomicrobium sp.]
MVSLQERLNCPISTAELERRWRAVREAMQRERIDALLIQNTNDYLGGYIKWFTDLPATTGYPITVIFPLDGPMTYISQGSLNLDREISPSGNQQFRGVGRVMGAPGYASAAFSARYEAEATERAFERFAGTTIGLVGQMHTAYLLDHLRRGALSKSHFVQACDVVDPLKCEKSEEEIALIRRTAEMQDACMRIVCEAIRPGMRDIEVGAIAECAGRSLGSEQGIFLCASGPEGEPAPYGIRHFQNRTIQKGDYVNILIENNGPGGVYTELGRTCVLGKASDSAKEEFEFVVKAQQFAIRLLTQGASAEAVWSAFNQYMRDNNRPEEGRLFCHGQGYDLVERPLIRFDETMKLPRRANIACHPTVNTRRSFSSCCDNFLFSLNGVERLHAFPQEIVEI